MNSSHRTGRLLASFKARQRERALQAAVAAWRAAAESRLAFRKQLQKVVDRRGLQLLRGAFCGWLEAAEACRAQRVRAISLAGHVESASQRCDRLWERRLCQHSATNPDAGPSLTDLMPAQEAVQEQVIRLCRSKLAAALHAWNEHCREVSAEREAERQRLQAAVRRLSRSRQAAVLAAWQLHARAKSAQRQLCLHAIRQPLCLTPKSAHFH